VGGGVYASALAKLAVIESWPDQVKQADRLFSGSRHIQATMRGDHRLGRGGNDRGGGRASLSMSSLSQFHSSFAKSFSSSGIL